MVLQKKVVVTCDVYSGTYSFIISNNKSCASIEIYVKIGIRNSNHVLNILKLRFFKLNNFYHKVLYVHTDSSVFKFKIFFCLFKFIEVKFLFNFFFNNQKQEFIYKLYNKKIRTVQQFQN